MVRITWKDGVPPIDMKIKQVYGIAFSEDGRILLKVEIIDNKKNFNLIGGKPETFDKDSVDTLKREFLEEVNTTLKSDLFLVGYQEIDEQNGKEPYAQLRFTCLIDRVGEVLPDSDNGKVYDRLLVPPEDVIKLLNWGKVGEMQINKAVLIAKEKFRFNKFSKEHTYI